MWEFEMVCIEFNRTETVNWGRPDGKAKVAGVIVCVAGATFMALYKGPALLGDGFSDLHLQGVAMAGKPAPEPFGWVAGVLIDYGIDLWHLGVLCLIGNSLCMALYIIYQVIGCHVSILCGSEAIHVSEFLFTLYFYVHILFEALKKIFDMLMQKVTICYVIQLDVLLPLES
jgi:hypothetical protein